MHSWHATQFRPEIGNDRGSLQTLVAITILVTPCAVALTLHAPTHFIHQRVLAAEIKLGAERVGARTAGGLQIFFPRDGNLIEWDRSYYEVSLDTSDLR